MHRFIVTAALLLFAGCAYQATPFDPDTDPMAYEPPEVEIVLEVTGVVAYCPPHTPAPDDVCPRLDSCDNVVEYLDAGALVLATMDAALPSYDAYKQCLRHEVIGCSRECAPIDSCEDWPSYLRTNGPPLEELERGSAAYRYQRDCLLDAYRSVCCAEANPNKCRSVYE